MNKWLCLTGFVIYILLSFINHTTASDVLGGCSRQLSSGQNKPKLIGVDILVVGEDWKCVGKHFTVVLAHTNPKNVHWTLSLISWYGRTLCKDTLSQGSVDDAATQVKRSPINGITLSTR